MTPLQLTVPAPAEFINANVQEHWAPRAKRVKAWRSAARLVARNKGEAFNGPVDVLFEFHKKPGRNTRWDPANLAPTAKACLDGAVDAGLLIDDDTKHVRTVTYVDGGRRDTPGVTITITPSKEQS